MLARIRQLLAPLTRRFEAATGGRRFDGWRASQFGSVNPEVLAAAAPVRARARHAFANNPWIANGVNAWATALIGAGITPSPQHPSAATRKLLGNAFASWAEIADADGRTDLYGLQAAVATAVVVDGESFAHMRVGPDGLRIQLIPAEFVDESLTQELGDGRRIVAGIEFDAAGNRVAYHVLRQRPTDLYGSYLPPVRVPAADVLHVFKPLGAGQVRGVSWLAPVLLTVNELDQLQDALLVGAKVAAMHAGFLVDQNGAGEPYDATAEGSIFTTGLEPGTLKRLPAGMDVKFSTPQQAHESVAFARLTLESIAAGLGIPEHLLTGNLANANYSSLRAGMVAFRARVEQLQFHIFIPQFCAPLWQRAVTTAVLSGSLDLSDFEARQSDYFACEWLPPKAEWVDPQKDAAAVREMLALGLTSRRKAVASLGYAVEELDEEIAADREREVSLGLSFMASPADSNPEPNPEKEPANDTA